MKKSFEMILKNQQKEFLQVIYISNGLLEGYYIEKVLELLKSYMKKKKIRIYSLGIGKNTSERFMRELSRIGQGYSEVVAEKERIEPRVVGLLKLCLVKKIEYTQIVWGEEMKAEELYPYQIPFHYSKVSISLKKEHNILFTL
jgi:hypothetical protein